MGVSDSERSARRRLTTPSLRGPLMPGARGRLYTPQYSRRGVPPSRPRTRDHSHVAFLAEKPKHRQARVRDRPAPARMRLCGLDTHHMTRISVMQEVRGSKVPKGPTVSGRQIRVCCETLHIRGGVKWSQEHGIGRRSWPIAVRRRGSRGLREMLLPPAVSPPVRRRANRKSQALPDAFPAATYCRIR